SGDIDQIPRTDTYRAATTAGHPSTESAGDVCVAARRRRGAETQRQGPSGAYVAVATDAGEGASHIQHLLAVDLGAVAARSQAEELVGRNIHASAVEEDEVRSGRTRRTRRSGGAGRSGGARPARRSGRPGRALSTRGAGRPGTAGRAGWAGWTRGAGRARGTSSAGRSRRSRRAGRPRAIRGRALVVAVDVLVVGAGGDVAAAVAVQVPARGPLRPGRPRRAGRPRGTGRTGRPRR